MTGVERLRAQVEGGSSANVVLPRAMMRDILRQVESDIEAARQESWEDGYVARAAEDMEGGGRR